MIYHVNLGLDFAYFFIFWELISFVALSTTKFRVNSFEPGPNL